MAFEGCGRRLGFGCAVAAALLVACSGGVRRYPRAAPLWVDPDQHPFSDKPAEYYSPFGWDAANQTLFRPIARFFAVDPAGEAANVNALDEVPDSSWFQNRIGMFAVSPERLARGPCTTPPLDPNRPWTVKDAKPDGFNPGFVIEGPDDRRYLIKFDGVDQGPRPTAADVLGTRVYWAAGYHTPCNRVVYFERDILRVAPDATVEDDRGRERPLTTADLDEVFSKAIQLRDGRYRASSSLFLEGKPLGPWTYEGRRDDDPNDVIPHEDRRDLRGMRVLAAWIHHFDSREQNTLSTFIETAPGKGYVRHNVLDFGDSLGSLWTPPELGRRIGHAYYLDVGDVLEDWVTLGLLERPWDRASFGPSGPVFAYFDVKSFEPASWKPGYPNPAFSRMRERDAAWMARILSRFTDAHLRALIATTDLRDPLLEQELSRILIGRRDRILARYLLGLSPLTAPVLSREGDTVRLCLRDAALDAATVRADTRGYRARGFWGEPLQATQLPVEGPLTGARACVALPVVAGASIERPRYLIVDVLASKGNGWQPPSRVHLYATGAAAFHIVALERPDDLDPPG
ncbi:MAG TPA: hypothetical protein VKZ49_09835 [Polyangiaceae bacterium]|nr:hypothetical protein [Polyangiaceae bacterium]